MVLDFFVLTMDFFWGDIGGYDIKELRDDVQVKNFVVINKFRQMLWCWNFFF